MLFSDSSSTPVSREAAIPAGAPKITPAEDPAPPVVHAAFASEFYDPEPVDGPINTDTERKAVPPEVLQKLGKLEDEVKIIVTPGAVEDPEQ